MAEAAATAAAAEAVLSDHTVDPLSLLLLLPLPLPPLQPLLAVCLASRSARWTAQGPSLLLVPILLLVHTAALLLEPAHPCFSRVRFQSGRWREGEGASERVRHTLLFGVAW